LEEIPLDLFLIRWRKYPDTIVLVKMYKIFYSTNGELGINWQDENTNDVEENSQDYGYLLNRIWYKVQQIVKAKPETAKNFYDSLDKSIKDLYASKEYSKPQNHGRIKNPKIIRPKGKFFKYNIIYLLIHSFIRFFLIII
jgi:hypothetical protein